MKIAVGIFCIFVGIVFLFIASFALEDVKKDNAMAGLVVIYAGGGGVALIGTGIFMLCV